MWNGRWRWCHNIDITCTNPQNTNSSPQNIFFSCKIFNSSPPNTNLFEQNTNLFPQNTLETAVTYRISLMCLIMFQSMSCRYVPHLDTYLALCSIFPYLHLHPLTTCLHVFTFLPWHVHLQTVCLSVCPGPNIYSQSMASLSGDIETPFSMTTTGHQLLLRWSSDHGTNRRGFNIRYVGEYQSMYPAYHNILLLLMLLEWKIQRSDKNHGFKSWV